MSFVIFNLNIVINLVEPCGNGYVETLSMIFYTLPHYILALPDMNNKLLPTLILNPMLIYAAEFMVKYLKVISTMKFPIRIWVSMIC